MAKIFVTHPIPRRGIDLLISKGFEVEVNPDELVLPKEKLIEKFLMTLG